MLNSETKNRINALRDILVGKIPDPKGQIEQITNGLIYKFMDDRDRKSESLGGVRSFFTQGLEPYAWYKFFDSKISNEDRSRLYMKGIEKLSESKHLPELFRSIFKEAYLPFRAADTIALFLHEINQFDYDNSEELGNAFEYLLSIMGSQGDAGQFRTPRHIIQFMVNVISPQKHETIFDPACGTSGFLIESYKHIQKNNELSNPDKQSLGKNISGIDLDPTMAKLAKVNLYLHGFQMPNITEEDTLTNKELWKKEKYNCILANPPFMTPKGGIKPHDKFTVQANRSEVLFVDYIAEHLKRNGRAGIIVPEGIIFQAARAYKSLRKHLIEDWGLYAVVSLPSGVFQPYSGVKTSILFLDRALKTDEIVFVKVHHDGFDLGAQRRTIDKNNLPEAFEILQRWKQGEKKKSDLALWVGKTKIAENGEYNLTGERYQETQNYKNVKYPMVELGEVCEVLDSKRKPITKSDRETGNYPYYGATGILDYVKDYIFNETLVLIGEDGAKWGKGDKTAFIATGKYWVNNHAHVLRPNRNKIMDKLVVELINSMDLTNYITGITVPKLNQANLKQIKIPLPPLKVQKQIVSEIEQWQKVIDGAKQIIENYKPSFRIDPEWELVKLGEVCEVSSGNSAPQDKNLFINGKYPFYRTYDVGLAHLSDNLINVRDWLNQEGIKKLKLFKKGTILFPKSGASTFLNHRVIMGLDGYVSSHLATISINNNLVNKKYIYYLLTEIDAKNIAPEQAYPSLKTSEISKIKIPIPPLEIQEQIVAEIEKEQQAVDSCKTLMETMEGKIKKKIGEVWEIGN